MWFQIHQNYSFTITTMTMNKLYLLLLCLLPNILVMSQNNTSSTYSRFGVGIIESKADVTSAGMGHTGIALGSTGFLNNLNAASYSALDSARFIFNLQGNMSFADYKTNTDSQTNFDANIGAISIGFRAGKNWGMGFSLSPYSSIGYKINGDKYILGTTDKYPVQYSGEGGISQLSWHNGLQLFKGFSLGLSASYMWGSTDIIETSFYPSIIGETTYNERNIHVSSLFFEYGFQWHQRVGNNTLMLGATANFSTELDTYYKQRIYNNATSDLWSDEENVDNSFIPAAYKAGLAFQNSKGFTLATDFAYNKWTESELAITNGETRDTYGGSLGLQYAPTRRHRSYLKNMHYRLGAFYHQEYLTIQGQNIDSQGLTAGITLPMRDGSKINIAYEYKLTGTNKAGLVEETFNTIRIGLTFNENWFQKSKFK